MTKFVDVIHDDDDNDNYYNNANDNFDDVDYIHYDDNDDTLKGLATHRKKRINILESPFHTCNHC
jgi:hypothetical protein